MACLFVFNGLEFGKKDQRPHVQTESLRAFEQAWELYDQQQADQVVDAFSGAGKTSFCTLFVRVYWFALTTLRHSRHTET